MKEKFHQAYYRKKAFLHDLEIVLMSDFTRSDQDVKKRIAGKKMTKSLKPKNVDKWIVSHLLNCMHAFYILHPAKRSRLNFAWFCFSL